MKKNTQVLGLFSSLLLIFSCISYGDPGEYGMDCIKPTIDAQEGDPTTFNFSCKNTTGVTFGSYQIFPDNDVIPPGATVSVTNNTCQNEPVGPGKLCAITGTFTAAQAGVYKVDFNDEYGGEQHYGIFCNNPEKECIEAKVTTLSYVVGDYLPEEGGVVFYVDPNGGNTLIVALKDVGDLQWSTDNSNVVNTSDALYAGYDNTIEMYNTASGGSPAATACLNYSDDIHNDWYIASKDALLELYNNVSVVNTTLGIVSGAQQISSVQYWSSSQPVGTNPIYAWNYDFVDGSLHFNNKTFDYSVRCVRDF